MTPYTCDIGDNHEVDYRIIVQTGVATLNPFQSMIPLLALYLPYVLSWMVSKSAGFLPIAPRDGVAVNTDQRG